MLTLKNYIDELNKNNLIEKFYISDELMKEPITKVSYNSKEVEANTLFVCKGIHYKPEYLTSAIENGAIAYISDNSKISEANFPHIVVTDIQKALATVSSLYYGHPAEKINMIGITGTKGKSTTAYYVKSILDVFMKKQNLPDTAIVSSIDTYDGVIKKEALITSPESLDLQNHIANAVNCHMQNLVMEVSSQALKLARVYTILYKVGVFLNISEDHISTIEHPDFEDYFTNKLKLFDQTENACVNLDADFADVILSHAKKCPHLVTFSTKNTNADVYGYSITKSGHETICFHVKTSTFDKEFILNMPGLFNVENALAAIATALCLHIPVDCIYEGLKIAKVSGRMEAHSSKDGSLIVIVDYAHNKLSFEKLYESTKQEYPDKKIVTVFGCPGGKAFLRRKDLGRLAGIHSAISYLTAEDPGVEETIDICNQIASHITKESGNYKIVEDRGEAIKEAILQNPNSVILITGKGNETRQKYGSKYVPCLTDTQYAKEALKEYEKQH